MEPFRYIAVFHDWPGNELREHDHISAEVDQIMLGFHIAAVYINGIAHRLECIKADAEWQSQAQEGNGRSYYGVDVVDEKVGVFEKEQHAKAADDTEQ